MGVREGGNLEEMGFGEKQGKEREDGAGKHFDI